MKLGEIFAILCLVAILFSFAVPTVTIGGVKSPMIQAVNNARQIQIATQSVASEQTTSGNMAMIGWPGTNHGFHEWITNLMTHANLGERDMIKLFSAPKSLKLKKLPEYEEGKTAFRVYQANESSSSDTIFLSTFNWNAETPNIPLSKKSVPYGDTGFVVFRKGGDGASYKPKQSSNLSILGTPTNNIGK